MSLVWRLYYHLSTKTLVKNVVILINDLWHGNAFLTVVLFLGLKVMFIWSVRDLFMVTSVLDYDKEYFQKNTNVRLPISFCPDLVVRGQPKRWWKTISISPEREIRPSLKKPTFVQKCNQIWNLVALTCQNYSLRWKAMPVRWARVKWRYWRVAQHHWWTQPRNCAPRSQVEALRLTAIRKSLSFDDQCQRSACQIQPNGKNLFSTPKRPERLHLRPWFHKYFCGLGLCWSNRSIEYNYFTNYKHTIYLPSFFSKEGNICIQSAMFKSDLHVLLVNNFLFKNTYSRFLLKTFFE